MRAVSAGTLFESKKPQSSWPKYKNGWNADSATIANAKFKQLLFPVPVKESDLQTLCSQFNERYQTNYTLAELDRDGLNFRLRKLIDQSQKATAAAIQIADK